MVPYSLGGGEVAWEGEFRGGGYGGLLRCCEGEQGWVETGLRWSCWSGLRCR